MLENGLKTVALIPCLSVPGCKLVKCRHSGCTLFHQCHFRLGHMPPSHTCAIRYTHSHPYRNFSGKARFLLGKGRLRLGEQERERTGDSWRYVLNVFLSLAGPGFWPNSMAWKPVSLHLEMVPALQMRTFGGKAKNLQGAAAQCCLLGYPGEGGGSWTSSSEPMSFSVVLHFEVMSSVTLSFPFLKIFIELDLLA